MRALSRSLLFLAILVATTATLAAACGGDDDGYGGSSPTAGNTAAPTSAALATTTTAKLLGVADTTKGKVLTDATGLTLYTFKPDVSAAGKSACTDSCATTWPPLTTTSATMSDKPEGAMGTFATITRDDGAKQVSYDSSPLYRFSGDKKAGDTNGDGVGGVWFVALATTQAASPSPTTGSQAQSSTSPAASGSSPAPSGASPTSAPPQPTATTAAAPTQPPTSAPTATTAPKATATTDPYGGGGYNY
jgi:predicted lipoprotein with Yx(FWY)xxD motif